MLCPVCRHDNFEGDDACANCGADLATSDIPQQLTEYHDTILGEHLEAVDAAPAVVVEPTLGLSDAIRRMQAEHLDCLLVCQGDRLLGIFTDRDAMVRVAGKQLDAFDIRDFMTPDPVVLRRDDTLAVAIHKMAIGEFRHIPIVDGECAIGVVSAADLFRHIASSLG